VLLVALGLAVLFSLPPLRHHADEISSSGRSAMWPKASYTESGTYSGAASCTGFGFWCELMWYFTLDASSSGGSDHVLVLNRFSMAAAGQSAVVCQLLWLLE
jgi:hypothetical protein